MKEFFTLKDKNWYQNGIKKLEERWLQMVEHNSLYFEYLAALVEIWRIKQISYQNIATLLTHLNIYI